MLGSRDDRGRGPTRTVGAVVVIVNGALAAYISRGARQLLVFLPDDEPARSMVGRALAATLARLARGEDGRLPLLVTEINGMPAAEHPFAPYLIEAEFSPSAMGLQIRRPVVGRGSPISGAWTVSSPRPRRCADRPSLPTSLPSCSMAPTARMLRPGRSCPPWRPARATTWL